MGCGSSKSTSTTQESPPASNTNNDRSVGDSSQHSPPASNTNNDRSGGGSSQKTDVKQQSSGNKFVDEAVEAHNRLRAKHGAPSMKPAQDLNNYSQNWANDLAKRDTMEHSKCTLPSGGGVGENIYYCWSSDPSAGVKAADAVQAWYDEIKDYNYNNPVFAMATGHFTQVVWKESVELGIAWAQAEGGSIYVVANYRPAGNMQGDFADNVLPQ